MRREAQPIEMIEIADLLARVGERKKAGEPAGRRSAARSWRE